MTNSSSSNCAYCGATVDGTRPPPEPDDGYGWLLEALEHKAGCEWAMTRGFLLLEPGLPLWPDPSHEHEPYAKEHE